MKREPLKSKVPERSKRQPKNVAAATGGTDSSTRMPGGRPSAYDPAYGEMLVAHCAQGLSIKAFAAVVDVTRDTLYEWARVHPEFASAMDRARSQMQLALEKAVLGTKNATEASVRLRLLANLDADTWREKKDIGLGGASDGKPVKVVNDLTFEDAYATYMRIIDDVEARVPKREGQ